MSRVPDARSRLLLLDHGHGPGVAGLRIVQVAPAWVPVPPPRYGGIEWVVHWLCHGLRDLGHEVMLVASSDSTCGVATRSAGSSAPDAIDASPLPPLLHSLEALEAIDDFGPDVVHDHTLLGPLCASAHPVSVATAHGPADDGLDEYYRRASARLNLVAITEAQRRSMPRVRWAATIHNGIDVSSFRFSVRKEPFLLFLGRMTEVKGAHVAVEAARRAGMPLVLSGRIAGEHERRYFDERVAPALGHGIDYIGETDDTQKRDLLARAAGLLFPILWDEPFGLVVVEALASGTPVIAFPPGSVSELLRDGETGFVVRDVGEMAAAARRLDRLDPASCRASAESRFDVSRMVSRYARLYRRLVRERSPAGAARSGPSLSSLGGSRRRRPGGPRAPVRPGYAR